MIDAILSPHATNTLTCGTAKWSACLADHLGVPHVGVDAHGGLYRHPLISARLTEMPVKWLCPERFDLFVHDWQDGWGWLVKSARRVYAANSDIAHALRAYRTDVTTILCPPTIQGKPDRGHYRVLTYGMAHKLVASYFELLKEKLEQAHPNYTVSLSTAVHEGSPWEASLQSSSQTLRAIFGDKLRVLGYLADDALAKELRDCDAVALFYSPALRGNNTTAWAALEAGKPLLTNVDDETPAVMRESVVHVPALARWPDWAVLDIQAKRGRTAAQVASWPRLIEALRVPLSDESGVSSGIWA